MLWRSMLKQYEQDAAFHVKPARLRGEMPLHLFAQGNRESSEISHFQESMWLVSGLVKLVSRGHRVGCRNPCTPGARKQVKLLSTVRRFGSGLLCCHQWFDLINGRCMVFGISAGVRNTKQMLSATIIDKNEITIR